MKRNIRMIWKWFLILSIPANIISLFFMACCMDSDTPIPFIVGSINAGWLLLLAIANEDRDKNKKREETGVEVRNQESRAV